MNNTRPRACGGPTIFQQQRRIFTYSLRTARSPSHTSIWPKLNIASTKNENRTGFTFLYVFCLGYQPLFSRVSLSWFTFKRVSRLDKRRMTRAYIIVFFFIKSFPRLLLVLLVAFLPCFSASVTLLCTLGCRGFYDGVCGG